MSVDFQKQSQLLDLLMDNELVKAAVIIDESGKAKGQRGRARCLRIGDGDAEETIQVTAPRRSSKESVYIAAAGDRGDFVLVIFEEQVSFDSLKDQIDEIIRQVDF